MKNTVREYLRRDGNSGGENTEEISDSQVREEWRIQYRFNSALVN